MVQAFAEGEHVVGLVLEHKCVNVDLGVAANHEHVDDEADIHRHKELDCVLVCREHLLEQENTCGGRHAQSPRLPKGSRRPRCACQSCLASAVGLQEDIHLGARLLDTFIDGGGMCSISLDSSSVSSSLTLMFLNLPESVNTRKSSIWEVRALASGYRCVWCCGRLSRGPRSDQAQLS